MKKRRSDSRQKGRNERRIEGRREDGRNERKKKE